MLEGNKQFRKWQWITARVEKARGDLRPESHRIFIDTIECETNPISTAGGWVQRLPHIAGFETFSTLSAVEQARLKSSATLALLKPARILRLEITKTREVDWTDEEKRKLMSFQRQGLLFAHADEVKLLRKLPYDFYYVYESNEQPGKTERRIKLVDWEVGALYWKTHAAYGVNWEQAFRQKIEIELPSKDLTILVGNMHQYQDQWLGVSLIYPPKRPLGQANQEDLFQP